MLRVLLVDDQQVELDGLSELLPWGELGLELVGGVRDARAALEMMGQGKIDIVVTDVIMQNMDGLTLVKTLKERYPKVRTVCISAFDDFKFVGAAVNNGACGYVLKPILANELISVLERVSQEIRKERWSGSFTPGNLAMLLLGARVEQLGEEAAEKPVCLVFSEKDAPPEALTGLSLEGGGSLYVLSAESACPPEDRASDPVAFSRVREAYEALFAQGESADDGRMDRDGVVNRIKQNVENHLSEDVDTRVLLEGVFLSASHASALFKNATGMSIHRYVVNRRLTEAARLLGEEPQVRVKDIAWRCGFSDASHLINSFQKKYGMTPEKYRRRRRPDEADQ